MGRRKSKKRVIKIRAPTVSKIFDCPFCNHSKTVECKLYEQQNPTKIPHSLKIPPHPNTKSHLPEPPNLSSYPNKKIHKIHRDKRKNIGSINCRICTVSFQTIIHR